MLWERTLARCWRYGVVWLGITLVFATCGLVVPDGRGWAAGTPGAGQFRVFKDHPEANDFAMVTSDGSRIRLSDLKGSVVILNFWRRNCHYCVMEKRHLKEMVQKLNRPDLKVVCVNFWDNPAEVQAYGRKNRGELVFASRPDRGRCVMENVVRGRVMGYYVLNEAGEAIYEVKGFPSSYVIDKEGRVIAGHIGLAQWAAASVRNWIFDLMGTQGPGNCLLQDQYQLPGWIDRLLNASPNRIPSSEMARGRRAQVGPTN
jgi:thiol-disulfide isomerase/thioredoxin